MEYVELSFEKFNASVVREQALASQQEAMRQEREYLQNAVLVAAGKGKFVVEHQINFPENRTWLMQRGFKLNHAHGQWDTGSALENFWVISWFVKDQNFIFTRQKGSSKL